MAENENEGKNKDLTKFLIMTLASIVIMFIVFAGVNYMIMENLISRSSKLSDIPTKVQKILYEFIKNRAYFPKKYFLQHLE